MLVRPVGPLARGMPRELVDNSLGGLRAYSDDEQRPGARLELELLFPGGGTAVFLAEVVWVETLPAGSPARFDVGLRFLDADPDDLERILALGEP
jgi:hypothetical protein